MTLTAKIFQACLNIPDRTRATASSLDFGDPDTVGLHVKRRSKTLADLNVYEDYGLYLGQQADGSFAVGIIDMNEPALTGKPAQVVSLENYRTLADLKTHWILD